MKRLLIISIGLCFIFVVGFFSCKPKKLDAIIQIKQGLIKQVDHFSATCTKFLAVAQSGHATGSQLQELFFQSRQAFKEFEWAAEYFDPATSRVVNGPPVVEVEGSTQILAPAGLQIMEGYLFPQYDSSHLKDIRVQLKGLQTACDSYKRRFSNIGFFDWQVLDAVKLEVYRIMTTGITGFDNPLTLRSMEESSVALASLGNVLRLYEEEIPENILVDQINKTVDYLKSHPDFNAFDRMNFILAYCNPLTTGISNLQEKLKINVTRYNRLLNQDAKTLFDSNAFNVNAYAPDYSSFVSEDKIVLGRKLFSDPILSGNGVRSCQSCHQPDKAFADGLTRNTVIGEHEFLERNTPTLINAALQPALFYDLRVKSLEDQSVNVVQSSKEMHGSMLMSVKKLWNDTVYRKLFLKSFPHEDKTRIDTFQVMNAIGSYVRSLVLLNSRFDQHMRGGTSTLNANEINGFNLFMGKAKCATCHYMPLFNGTFPPRYIKIESEVIGVPSTTDPHVVDGDLGRYNMMKIASFKHAFKTPTVRNAELTAPYMHNGVFKTLEEVIDFYDEGGGVGRTLAVENQTLPSDSLHLSAQEKSDLIAFIKTLNSTLPKY